MDYQFACHAPCIYVEEKRIHKLTRVNEIGYGERAERPQRQTEFERDSIGRLLAKLNADARQD